MKNLLLILLQRLFGIKEANIWDDHLDDVPSDDVVTKVTKRIMMKNDSFQYKFIEDITRQVIEEYTSVIRETPAAGK